MKNTFEIAGPRNPCRFLYSIAFYSDLCKSYVIVTLPQRTVVRGYFLQAQGLKELARALSQSFSDFQIPPEDL